MTSNETSEYGCTLASWRQKFHSQSNKSILVHWSSWWSLLTADDEFAFDSSKQVHQQQHLHMMSQDSSFSESSKVARTESGQQSVLATSERLGNEEFRCESPQLCSSLLGASEMMKGRHSASQRVQFSECQHSQKLVKSSSINKCNRFKLEQAEGRSQKVELASSEQCDSRLSKSGPQFEPASRTMAELEASNSSAKDDTQRQPKPVTRSYLKRCAMAAARTSNQQPSRGNQLRLSQLKLAQIVFIYISITSILIVPMSSSNYWPQRRAANGEQQELQKTGKQTGSRQLMIGQHYNNFSSIVPYSIVQDSDYGQSVEDQLMEEQQQQQDELDESSPHQSRSQLGLTNFLAADNKRHLKESNSRALLPLDSSRLILPQMQQIKSRFNQGCVGGTKCQFFAFCWMSGGSLGASCGLLMTCCVTPSRQEIQPGFYGPVVNDPYCGRSTSKINRIVGGTDASFGQFPWQAFVQVGGSRCGGALISSRHVVTAGHCVARSQHSPSSIKVTLGDYILNSDIESIPHEVFSVVEVLLHPNFRFTPQADRYDVAVLELDRSAAYKDNIKPICLPQKDATFVGRVAYVAGWGALQAGSKLRPKVLQHVAVPVIENQVCESWHRRKGIDIRIYDEMMCAGYELGARDACQGDSGGPLMLNQFGVWYLVGIVSAGYSCAKQYQPGIYHRVSSSSDWISSNVYQQGASK